MISIANRQIGAGQPPYIIAEVSCNHAGSIDRALHLIRAARYAGADAVKFQAYTPDTITLDCNKPDFIIQDGLWKGKTLYDLYKETYTPFEWFPKLFKAAQKEGITAFASVFDPSAVDMLDRLGCPAYKIASMELIDIPLIEYTAKMGKPMILSTGMAKRKEIQDAVDAVGRPCAVLHCTSEYPGTVEWSDLGGIQRLKSLLPDCAVGLSDHTTNPYIVPVAAAALGVAVIEKHIMLEGGETEDEEFSLEPDDFKYMVEVVKRTHEAMKPREFASNPSFQFRRSLYAVEEIRAGDTFTTANLRSIRPGYGVAPKNLSKLLGKVSTQNYRKGDRIT